MLGCVLSVAAILQIAAQGYDPRTSEPTVAFQLAPDSAPKLIEVMRQNAGRPVEMRVDAKVLSRPFFSAFPNGVLVTGHFSEQDAQDLAGRITEGAKLEIESPPN
jgi:preprotein translocase subunit SecD